MYLMLQDTPTIQIFRCSYMHVASYTVLVHWCVIFHEVALTYHTIIAGSHWTSTSRTTSDTPGLGHETHTEWGGKWSPADVSSRPSTQSQVAAQK